LARIVVVVAIAGAALFAVYLGYLAWANGSFPTAERAFSQYANVTSSNFNGTEFAFNLQWKDSAYLPVKAQLTSPATDAANTPACDIGLSSVKSGQPIFLPFTISPPSATLSNVNLYIEVQSVGSGSDFTIVYNVPMVSATNVLITPSNITCQEPLGTQ
jgi:hypothetical protein